MVRNEKNEVKDICKMLTFFHVSKVDFFCPEDENVKVVKSKVISRKEDNTLDHQKVIEYLKVTQKILREISFKFHDLPDIRYIPDMSDISY